MDHALTHLGSDIFLVKGLLDASLCQHILQVAECFQFIEATVELQRSDRQSRNNSMLNLDGEHALLQSTNQLLLGKIGIVQKLLYKHYGIGFPHSEACSILRYRPGEFYKRHVDNILLSSRLEEAEKGVPVRDVSIVGFLNEGFEGGELYFDRQDIKIKPQAGDVAVFPAFYLFPHQSRPVTRGCKYSFVTWLYH